MRKKDIAPHLKLVSWDGRRMVDPPNAAEIVIMIGDAMGHRAPAPNRRVMVEANPGDASEGRKIAELYLGIRSARARQAIADAMVAIVARNPD